MKSKFLSHFVTPIIILFIASLVPKLDFAQKDSLNGIEALSFFKSRSQSMILTYGANIPDTSKIYRESNLKINFAYNDVKSKYDQYRGFMKDCIINNTSIKKLKECLKSKNLELKNQLDSLQGLIQKAYLMQYISSPPKDHSIKDTSINTGIAGPDFIQSLVSALADGAIKIWTQINNLKKQEKDTYLSQISSKDYDLLEYNELINASKKK